MTPWCDPTRADVWRTLHPDLLGPWPSEVGVVFDALPQRASVVELFPGARPPLEHEPRPDLVHWQLDAEAWTLDPRRSRLVLGALHHLACTPRLADADIAAVVCSTRLWPALERLDAGLDAIAQAVGPHGALALRYCAPAEGEVRFGSVAVTTRRDGDRRVEVRVEPTVAEPLVTRGVWLERDRWRDAARRRFGDRAMFDDGWLLVPSLRANDPSRASQT